MRNPRCLADGRYEASRPKSSEDAEVEEDVTKVCINLVDDERKLILDLLYLPNPYPTPPTHFRTTQDVFP